MTPDSAHKTRIIGLTGGAGSGKSEAARRFTEKGIPVIDADRIGHEVLETPEVHDEIVAAFGPEVLSADGSIDREKLATRVFMNGQALQQLNDLTHPRIKSRIARRIAEFWQQGYPAVIVDAALIAEDGRKEPWLDRLVLVLSDEAVRVDRLVRMRGMPPDEVRRRIRAQTPPESKSAAADWIIQNNGTLEELYGQVDAIATQILETA